MPQVFSIGWLYLFIFVMAICIAWIWMKIRTIQKDAPMDRSVIKVTPIIKPEPDQDEDPGPSPLFEESDNLIKRGDYGQALGSLEHLLEDLSPTENRADRGRALFRIGACYSRLADGEVRLQYLLRANEALKEAARLFSPARFRKQYLRALNELIDLSEDLAREKNPVEYLTQASRTCETAIVSARESDMVVPEAIFLARSGRIYKWLASHTERHVNLKKAAEAYEKCAPILETVEGDNAASERMKVLWELGDTLKGLAAYYQKTQTLERAVTTFEQALAMMDAEQHARERSEILTDISNILLELYDSEKQPAHLHQALRFSRSSLEATKGNESLILRSMAMVAMADSLVRYAEFKDRQDNLKRAIKLYEASLATLNDKEHVEELEMVQGKLAETTGKLGEYK